MVTNPVAGDREETEGGKYSREFLSREWMLFLDQFLTNLSLVYVSVIYLLLNITKNLLTYNCLMENANGTCF